MQGRSGFRCLGLAVWFAAVGALLGCGKGPGTVVCRVTYGGEVKRLEFPATRSPYGVKAVDIAGRFAFKAIYLHAPSQAPAINVYVYQRTDTEDRLLQEGKYRSPFSIGGEARYGFTGRQLVYSRDQRELEYWCELSP